MLVFSRRSLQRRWLPLAILNSGRADVLIGRRRSDEEEMVEDRNTLTDRQSGQENSYLTCNDEDIYPFNPLSRSASHSYSLLCKLRVSNAVILAGRNGLFKCRYHKETGSPFGL